MFAETKSTADAAQTIYPYEIPRLLEALKDEAKSRVSFRSRVRSEFQQHQERGGVFYGSTRQRAWEDVEVTDLQLEHRLTLFLNQHWSATATIAVGILTIIVFLGIGITMYNTTLLDEETSRYKEGTAERRNALEDALRQVFSRHDGHDSLERETARVVNTRLRDIECLLDAIAKKLLVDKLVTGGLEPRPQCYEQNVTLPVYQQPLE